MPMAVGSWRRWGTSFQRKFPEMRWVPGGSWMAGRPWDSVTGRGFWFDWTSTGQVAGPPGRGTQLW